MFAIFQFLQGCGKPVMIPVNNIFQPTFPVSPILLSHHLFMQAAAHVSDLKIMDTFKLTCSFPKDGINTFTGTHYDNF